MIADLNLLCHVIEGYQKRTESDLPVFLNKSKVNFSKALIFIICELSESLPCSAKKLSEMIMISDCDAIIFEDETLFNEFVNFFPQHHLFEKCTLCKVQSSIQVGDDNEYMNDSGIDFLKEMGTINNQDFIEENADINQQESTPIESNLCFDSVDLIQCEYCGHTTKTDKQMKNHYYKKHFNTEKSFECSKCDKSFNRKTDLNKHFLVHSNVRLSCKVCPKSFKRESDLKIHELSHSVNFKCNECPSVFTKKNALLRHHRSLHSDVDSPFTCKFCNKLIKRSDNFKIHVNKCSKK